MLFDDGLKMFRKRLLYGLLRLVLVIGLLRMSNHMYAMQTMQIDEAMDSSMGVYQSNLTTKNTIENSARSCCDAICPFSFACAFMVPQSVSIAVYEDSERIPYSAFIVRSIYPQSASPPPKP